MQLANSSNNNKGNPLMIPLSEDPINTSSNNENKIQNSKIMEENRQLGAENLEVKNALA